MKKRVIPICAAICALALFATSQFYSQPAAKISGENLKRMHARLKGLPDIKAMYENAEKMNVEEISESIKGFEEAIKKYQKIGTLGPLDSVIIGFLIEFMETSLAVFEEVKMVIEKRQKPAQR